MILNMYKIIFHFYRTQDETYGGGYYYVNKEKYAVFNSFKPKLFKSEKVAINSAERLINSCINCAEDLDYYEIVKVECI